MNTTFDALAPRFNTKGELVTFVPGQLVLEWKPVGDKGLANKVLRQWKGPFLLEQKTSPVNCRICSLKGKMIFLVVAAEKLKIYNVREDEPDEEFWATDANEF